MIIGGFNAGFLADAVIFNAETLSSSQIVCLSNFKFQCKSNSVMVKEGIFYSLVLDSHRDSHLINFCLQNKSITIVKTFF